MSNLKDDSNVIPFVKPREDGLEFRKREVPQHLTDLLRRTSEVLMAATRIQLAPVLPPPGHCYIYEIVAIDEEKKIYRQSNWIADDIEHAIEQFKDLSEENASLKIIDISITGLHKYETDV